MNNIEKCKQEIKDYLNSEGWIKPTKVGDVPLFRNGGHEIVDIYISYFMNNPNPKSKKVVKSIQRNSIENVAKYFLEYIGYILRKHKIKEVSIFPRIYGSDTWKINEINLITK